MSRDGAALGFFVSLEAPTKPTLAEALAAGSYRSPAGVGRQVPTLQVRTVGELLGGRDFDFPVPGSNASFPPGRRHRCRRRAGHAGAGVGRPCFIACLPG